MPAEPILSSEDQDLLLQMLCCVIAADGKVSEREIRVVANTLGTIGSELTCEKIRILVVEYCKLIHAKGVGKYLDLLLPQVYHMRESVAAQAFALAHETLTKAGAAADATVDGVADRILSVVKGSPGSLEDAFTGGLSPTVNSTPSASCGVKLWKVALATALFPPLGCFLIWRHPVIRRNPRWWFAAIAWWVLIALAAPKSDQPPTSDSGSDRKDPAVRHLNRSAALTRRQLTVVCSKAKHLRIGMSERDVLRLIGTPTETVHCEPAFIDPSVRIALGVNDDTPSDLHTWHDDPMSGFICIAIRDGVVAEGQVSEGSGKSPYMLRP